MRQLKNNFFTKEINMLEKPNDISTAKSPDIEKIDNKHNEFKKRTIRLAALACNRFERDDFDLDVAERESHEGFKALGANGALQEMLVAQMLSIHRLQQTSITVANEITNIEHRQYFTNTAIKLANTFVQQANLLSRLQGNGGQKIIVERVDVHSGGQAVVGNINGGFPNDEVKK